MHATTWRRSPAETTQGDAADTFCDPCIPPEFTRSRWGSSPDEIHTSSHGQLLRWISIRAAAPGSYAWTGRPPRASTDSGGTPRNAEDGSGVA